MPKRDYYVQVCSECLTAACWHGEHMCSSSDRASTVILRASELRKLKREHPSNYSQKKVLEVCNCVQYTGE